VKWRPIQQARDRQTGKIDLQLIDYRLQSNGSRTRLRWPRPVRAQGGRTTVRQRAIFFGP
jgi:hypothetical protein